PNGCVLLDAGAGVFLPKLAKDFVNQGLSGLEWGAGVPGTIGGAIVSNAGAHDACIADTLEFARVLAVPTAPGERAKLFDRPRDACALGYRRSCFRAAREVTFDEQGRPILVPRAQTEPTEMILGGTFLLKRDDPTAIRSRVNAYQKYRKDKQPPQPN